MPLQMIYGLLQHHAGFSLACDFYCGGGGGGRFFSCRHFAEKLVAQFDLEVKVEIEEMMGKVWCDVLMVCAAGNVDGETEKHSVNKRKKEKHYTAYAEEDTEQHEKDMVALVCKRVSWQNCKGKSDELSGFGLGRRYSAEEEEEEEDKQEEEDSWSGGSDTCHSDGEWEVKALLTKEIGVVVGVEVMT